MIQYAVFSLILFSGVYADQIKVIANEKVDLRGHSLAILKFAFIGKEYMIREVELDYFRNRLAKELANSGIKMIDNEIVASIQKETIQSKKVSSEMIPKAIAEKVNAEYFLAGQALIDDRESGPYVKQSLIFLYRTSDRIPVLEFQLKKSEYSIPEFTDVFIENFNSATNTLSMGNRDKDSFSVKPPAATEDYFAKLEDLIIAGNISLFKKEKQNIHLKNEDGESLLTKTIKYDKIEFTKFLIQDKVNINSCTTAFASNFSELQSAVRSGKIEFVKLLIENGADIHHICNLGYSVMHEAAMRENNEILEYLIRKGGNINAKDKGGDTPLHYSVMARDPNLEFVKFLLKKGAKVNLLNDENTSPLLTASANKNSLSVVKVMRESGGDINVQGKQPYGGWAPILWACSKGEVDLFEYLVREGADKNVKSEKHGTCKDLAQKNNHSDILNLLQK